MSRLLVSLLFLLTLVLVLGCGGHSAQPSGQEYIVATWNFGPDIDQRNEAIDLCNQYGVSLNKRNGPYFWSNLTAANIIALESDSRVAHVGEYIVTPIGSFRRSAADRETLARNLQAKYGFTLRSSYFETSSFLAQMPDAMRTQLRQDPRIEFVDFNLVGGGASAGLK